MIFELMRQDPGFRLALWMTAISAVVWPLVPFHSPSSAIAPTCGILLACLARARPHERASLFHAGLPVAARQLFLARLLSLLCMVWLPLLAGGFTIALARTSEMPAAMLLWAAMFSLPVLILQSVRIQETAAPRWLLFPVVAIGLPACAVLPLWVRPGILALLCGGAFLAILALVWMAIPPSFQVASMEATEVRAAARGSRFQLPPWWPMVRSALTPVMLAFVVFILMQAMNGEWITAACFSLVLLGQAQYGTRWLFGLPVSHRTRLLIQLAPALLPVVIGAALGANLSIRPFAHPQVVHIGGAQFAGGSDEPYRPGIPNVQVPLEYWRHAAGGRAPEIRAPWGESVQPATVRVLGTEFYNPYEVARSNSQRFMDWQLARATIDIYGRPIDHSHLARGVPSVSATARLQVLELAAILIVVLTIAGGLQFAAGRWVGRLGSKVAYAISFAMVAPFLAIFAFDIVSSPAVPRLGEHLIPLLLVHCSRTLPGNLAVAAAITAIPVLAAYLFAEQMAAQVELGSSAVTAA